jgi:hypothetical protein
MKPLLDEIDQALWAAHAWRRDARPYFRARIKGKMLALHRVIADAAPGQIVDHIDGDPMNCRRSNLRVCDSSGSARNRGRKRTSKSPYKGVWLKPSGRWQAIIMVDKKFKSLGVHDTAELAARAYDVAAKRLHGEFARLNGV